MNRLILVFLVGLVITSLLLYLLSVFNVLYLWTFLLTFFGGMLLTGLFVDRTAKKKNLKINYQGPDNANEAQRTYTENMLEHSKNDMHSGGL